MESKLEGVVLSAHQGAASVGPGVIDARKKFYGLAVTGGWLGKQQCSLRATQSSCPPSQVLAKQAA